MNQDYINDKSCYRLYYGESNNDEGACSSNSHIINTKEEKQHQHIEIDFKNELIENSKCSNNSIDIIESISINYDNLQSPPNIEQPKPQQQPPNEEIAIKNKKKKKRISNIKWWKSKFKFNEFKNTNKEIQINYNNQANNDMTLEKLSNELLVLIYSYLDPESLGRLSIISKRLNLVSSDPSIWKFVIRNWQCNTVSKLKKKIYSKKNLVNRILVPPLILDDKGELVQGPLPPYDSVIAHQLTRLNTTMETANAINEFISAQLNNSESSDFQDNDSNTTIPKLRNFTNNNKQLAIQQKHPKKLKSENNIVVLKRLNNSNGNSGVGGKKEIKTKEYYIESYIKIKKELENRENIVKIQEKHQKRLNDISITSKIMFYSFFSRPSEWVSILFLILFTVFVGLKLDGYIELSWTMVFIPMMLLMFQFLITPLIFVFFKTIFGHSYEEELSPDSFIKPLFFSLFFIIPLQPGQKIYTAILFTPIFCMLSFIVLLICQLQLVVSELSVTIVFLPLFIFCVFILVLVVIFPERINTSIKTYDFIAMVSCSIFFSAFILFLYLNVGKIVEFDWNIVFTPLYILKSITIIYPILIRLLHVSKYASKLTNKSGWFKDPGSLNIVVLFFLLVLGPLFIFEILLIQNLNSNMIVFKYTIVLVPIFFIEFLMACGCFVINLAFGHRNQN